MTNQNNTPSETYAINLNHNEPRYFSMMPGVIHHCTYIAKETKKGREHYGELVRKKLSSTAIALYSLIKQLGGQNEKSWACTKTLAEMLDKSSGAIVEAKRELAQPIEQLNGNPLIKIEVRKKKHATGAKTYHVITTTNIWPENNAYMSILKHHPKLPLGIVHNHSTDSQDESMRTTDSQDESSSLETDSPIECNQNNRELDESCNNRKEAATAASVCDLASEDPVKIHQNQADHIKTNLAKFGCDNNFINEMLRRFSLKQIDEGAYYTSQQHKRKPKDNYLGYLRDAIENGRVWALC